MTRRHPFGPIVPIMRKELKQIIRDPRTVAILFVLPAALLLLVGYAITFDVKHVKIAVLDEDQSQYSRDVVSSFVNSEYFDYAYVARDEEEIGAMIDKGLAKLAVIIPPKFGDHLGLRETQPIQLIIDGANANTASTILGYVNAAVESYNGELRTRAFMKMGAAPPVPIDMRPRIWYNPDLKSVRFLIPGLIAYVLMITAVVATAMSIVREKERGTMEQVIVSPVSAMQLIVGKLVPYLVIALVAMSILLTAAWLVFGVGVAGSFVLLFIATTLFLICALGVGLLVSTIADNQQVAFQIATLVSTLPAIILSGFIFPIRSMPIAIQIATNMTPAKFFVRSLRGIMLKGVGLSAFWQDWVAMAVFAIVVIGLSVLRMRRQTA